MASRASRITLSTLKNNYGAHKPKTRVGRGRSSPKGKTSGRGHKGVGQHGRSPAWMTGGQTPMFRSIPKHGYTNRTQVRYEPLNLQKLKDFIERGKLDATKPVNMKTLSDAGAVGRIEHGVKLLAEGADDFNIAIDLEVTRASKKAIETIEGAGGQIVCKYYDRVGLRALLKPEKFHVQPRHAAPPLKKREYYEDKENRGYLAVEKGSAKETEESA